MKAWIRFTRIQSGTDQEVWIIEIDRRVEFLILAIVVDDGDTLADGTGAQFFVLDVQRHLIPEILPCAGVECVALERARLGRGDVDDVGEHAIVCTVGTVWSF